MPRDAFPFEDTNRTTSPKMCPKKFRDFRETGTCCVAYAGRLGRSGQFLGLLRD